MTKVAVAAANSAALEAGLEIAAEGGNAVDAAVAASIAAMCTDPGMVSIMRGGYGNLWPVGGVPVGIWINAVITFLILAAVVYFFIVVPYNKLQERRARGEEPMPPSEEVTLLTEIRDELRSRGGSGGV